MMRLEAIAGINKFLSIPCDFTFKEIPKEEECLQIIECYIYAHEDIPRDAVEHLRLEAIEAVNKLRDHIVVKLP